MTSEVRECRKMVSEGMLSYPCTIKLAFGQREHEGPCASTDVPGSLERRRSWLAMSPEDRARREQRAREARERLFEHQGEAQPPGGHRPYDPQPVVEVQEFEAQPLEQPGTSVSIDVSGDVRPMVRTALDAAHRQQGRLEAVLAMTEAMLESLRAQYAGVSESIEMLNEVARLLGN